MEEIKVTIKRLEENNDAQQAYCCMQEAPTPWPETLCDCRDWVTENLGNYVEGFHLQLANGDVVGHLYYALSENALIAYDLEPNVGVLYCDWVQTRYQGKGLGTRLFNAFVDEMRERQVKGIIAEATDHEAQMHYSHYVSRGFEIIHEREHSKLMYYPLEQATIEINPLTPRVIPVSSTPIDILIVNGYMCPFETSTIAMTRLVAQEFGDRITLREVRLTPDTVKELGVAKGIFINGEQKLFGGETEEQVRQVILEDI
jgi:predicted GNAT family acetyltransferase